MIKEERRGTLARRRRKRVTSRGEKDAFARGGLTSDEQGRGAHETETARKRERREERSEEGGEERSKGLRRKEKGTRKEGGERDEAKQRRIEAGCCAVTVH